LREGRVEEMAGKVDEMTQMSGKIEEMGGKMGELQETVRGLQDGNDEEMAGKVETVSGKVEDLAGKIAELEEGKASAGRLESEMHEVKLLRDRVVTIEENSAALQSLAEKVQGVEGKMAEFEGVYVTNSALEAALSQNLQATDVELLPLQSRVDEMVKKIAALEAGGVTDEGVAALECIQKLEQQVALAAPLAHVTSIDAKVEALTARIPVLEEVVHALKGAGDDDLVARAKEEMLKEIQDKIQEAESTIEKNVNFRLDQMKVDELKKNLVELTKVCNVNSESINAVDTRMEEKMQRMEEKVQTMKEIIHEFVDDDK